MPASQREVILQLFCLSVWSIPAAHLYERSFQAAGSRLWNSLPSSHQQPGLSIGQFRNELKTHYFCLPRARRFMMSC